MNHDNLIDTNIAPPKPFPAMFPGLVDAVQKAACAYTEVNPVAVAANFLSFLGAMAGRDVYLMIGDKRHHPRIFTLHIGRSAMGGKGEALALVERIAARIAEQYPGLLGQIHTGGLSSREGLAMKIHDGYTQGKEMIQPVADKRLWVVEEEFANVLAQAKRDGNTLSPAIRSAWDGATIKPATKSAVMGVDYPHIGIAASITPSELHSMMSERELSNGFANRFLMFWAERTCDIPFPRTAGPDIVADLAERTAAVIRFALGDYPNTRDSRAMRMDQCAADIYHHQYIKLRRERQTDLMAGLLARRAPYLLRLAMLFALCDETLVIKENHIEAAYSWIVYSTESVRYVFANHAQEARAAAVEGMAERVVMFLVERPDGATQDEIGSECFAKKGTPIPLRDEVLGMMAADHRYGVEMEERPRADGRAGKPAKFYRLSAEKLRGISGVSFYTAATRVLPDFQPAGLGGVSFLNGQNPAPADLTPPNPATPKTAESRANAGQNLTPLTPPLFSENPPWHGQEVAHNDTPSNRPLAV